MLRRNSQSVSRAGGSPPSVSQLQARKTEEACFQMRMRTQFDQPDDYFCTCFNHQTNYPKRKGQYLHVTAASVRLFSCKPGSFGNTDDCNIM